MTTYYYIATESLSDIWETTKIENYLLSFGFLHKSDDGEFGCESPYLIISLMKVKNKDSWSSLDYNKDETNYISIITSDSSEQETKVKNVLKGLEMFLGSKICPDE